MKNSKFNTLFEEIEDYIQSAEVQDDRICTCELCGTDFPCEEMIKDKTGALICKSCAEEQNEEF